MGGCLDRTSQGQKARSMRYFGVQGEVINGKKQDIGEKGKGKERRMVRKWFQSLM